MQLVQTPEQYKEKKINANTQRQEFKVYCVWFNQQFVELCSLRLGYTQRSQHNEGKEFDKKET